MQLLREAPQPKVLVVICSYNEAASLPSLLSTLGERSVLVVDDGSEDRTSEEARSYGCALMKHRKRLGKVVSENEAVHFAASNGYDVVVEIGADALPGEGAIGRLVAALRGPGVVGASAKQVPSGPSDVAGRIDELIWALLYQGKRLQMARYGTCHLGGVMFAFKTGLVGSIEGCVNDDEEIGVMIRTHGYRTTFVEDAVVRFDSSSCIGHVVERRRRMYFGHMVYEKSTAPSMDVRIMAVAFVKAVLERPSRLLWAVPALLLDTYARLTAWADTRKSGRTERYVRWSTTYAKNTPFVIRSSPRR